MERYDINKSMYFMLDCWVSVFSDWNMEQYDKNKSDFLFNKVRNLFHRLPTNNKIWLILHCFIYLLQKSIMFSGRNIVTRLWSARLREYLICVCI